MSRQSECESAVHLWVEPVCAEPQERMFHRGRLELAAIEAFVGHPVGPEWIIRSPGRKPKLRIPGKPAGWVDYSVSYSAGVCAVAVACRRAVGVDIERTESVPITSELLWLVADECERMSVRALADEHETLAAFFRLWTRKEAVLKACGVGLSLSPALVHVGLPDCERSCVTLPDNSLWYVRSLPEIEGAALAIASDEPIGRVFCHVGRPPMDCCAPPSAAVHSILSSGH